MSETLLVTGATGYLASWVVKLLLEAGYSVHATVRMLSNVEKLRHLNDLQQQYPGQLELFEADLLKPNSFDTAIQDCSLVIHTASPYFLDKPKDLQQELIKPAIDGTLNVLDSVQRTSTVKRVVLTSSIAALYNDASDMADAVDHTVRETDTNTNHDEHHNSYAYSKTMAEQAAWKKQREQNRWDMISIHPGAIFGPSLSRRDDATSVNMIRQFINGTMQVGVPQLTLGLVDVRDVAKAHVNAALHRQAQGRYIVVAKSLRLLAMAQLMRIKDFGLKDKLPKRELPKFLFWVIAPLVGLQRDYVIRNVGYEIYFDSSRSCRELGIEYHSPEQTLNDHIAQLVADKLVQI